MKVPHDPDEVLAVVDENDTVIGKASRKEVHEKKLLHREVTSFLVNSKNEVLLQKRADAHIWDFSSGGHVPFSQSYSEAFMREFKEELGVKLGEKDFVAVMKEKIDSKSITNYRFVTLFIVKKDIPVSSMKIDRAEIEEVKYFNKEALESLLSSPAHVITNASKELLKRFVIGKFV